MMQKWIYAILLMTLFSGCATEFNLATGQKESLIYGTDKEVALGNKIAGQLEKQFGIVYDVDVNKKAQRALERIVEAVHRKDIVFVVRILDDEMVNAVSLPGGYIYLFKGLVEKMDSEETFAAVIAHEAGHVAARHSIKRLQAAYAQMLLQGAAIATRDPDLAYGANALYTMAFLNYSRKDEFEADRLAVQYMRKAGYDPHGVVRVLKILQEAQQEAGIRPKSYFRTHPHISERLAFVRKEIRGYPEFRDYLNIMGN